MAGEEVEVVFEGADGAIRFASDDLVRDFQRVVHGWPQEHPHIAKDLFADVRLEGARWSVEILRPEPRQKSYDPVNGICDLIVELNWSRLRQNTQLICLHAAGVDMGQALVVFPSKRRAGKSTLTAELARRGHPVFTDDILAVQLNAKGVAEGLATGVSPRLRLPLPPDVSPRFADWVAGDTGPANRQYKYLTEAPVASFGAPSPIGAIVTLNRVTEDVPPRFEDINVKDVLPVLIHQNFGRFANSGHILSALGAIASDLPCLELTYGNFETAADFLEAAVQDGLLSVGAIADTGRKDLPDFDMTHAPFDAARRYHRRAGFQCIETGDEAFISDASGRGIFRMGPGMMPIWVLLEEPITLMEIVAVMHDIYMEVDSETIKRDVRTGLQKLNKAGLIEAVSD